MPDAPGSGALNAGYAVTYGDLGETNRMNLVNLLDRQNEERQQRLQAQQKDDEAHRFALQKYYGKEFDPNNFDTQTDLNQRLSDMATGSLKKVSDLINSGASDEDIDRAANQELSGIQKTYQVASAVKRNVDGSLEGLQNDKTLAPYLGSLKKQAFINALYTKDTNGKLRLKNDQELSQIDPNQNFAGDILQHNPQLVMNGNIDWNAQLKKFTAKTFKNSGEYYSSPGVKKAGSYEAQYYDGAQKIATDKKGVTSVETANDPIITKDANGNPVKIDQAPDYVMTALQSTPGEKANMDVATMHWLAQHSPEVSVEPNTPAFEVAKKKMVYDALNNQSPKLIGSSNKENMSTLVIRDQLHYPRPGEGKGTSADENAEINKSFNSISGVKYYKDSGVGAVPVGNITNGKADGPVQNGEVLMRLEDLPIAIRNAVAKYSPGNDVSGVVTGRRKVNKEGLLQVELTNGAVSGVMTDKGQWFRATDLTNANIKEQNTTLPSKEKLHYIQGSGGTYQLGGKTITDDMLQKGAKKYGMTVEQYKASIRLK